MAREIPITLAQFTNARNMVIDARHLGVVVPVEIDTPHISSSSSTAETARLLIGSLNLDQLRSWADNLRNEGQRLSMMYREAPSDSLSFDMINVHALSVMVNREIGRKSL